MTTISALPLFLGGVRVAYALLAYVTPQQFEKLTRLDETGHSPDSGYVARLYAARDLALGLATVAPTTQRTGLLLGATVDALDTLSAVIARTEGKDRRWVYTATAATGAFAVLGAAAAQRSSGTPRRQA